MLKIYCANCGEANHYLDKKPSVCGYCQKAFNVAKITSANKPAPAKSQIVVRADEPEPAEPSPELGDFKAEIAGAKPKGVKLDQIVNANITTRRITNAKILDKKTFWNQFRDESRNKGYEAVADIDEGDE